MENNAKKNNSIQRIAGKNARKDAVKNFILKLEIESGLSCKDVWHNALLTSAAYTNIFNKSIMPQRSTLLCLGVAFRLNHEQIKKLFELAGYVYPYYAEEMVVDYFARKDLYACDELRNKYPAIDLYRINELLTRLGLPELGNEKTKNLHKEAVGAIINAISVSEKFEEEVLDFIRNNKEII